MIVVVVVVEYNILVIKNIIVEGPRIRTLQNRLFSHILVQNVYSRPSDSIRHGMACFVVALGLRWRSSVCFFVFLEVYKQKRT